MVEVRTPLTPEIGGANDESFCKGELPSVEHSWLEYPHVPLQMVHVPASYVFFT